MLDHFRASDSDKSSQEISAGENEGLEDSITDYSDVGQEKVKIQIPTVKWSLYGGFLLKNKNKELRRRMGLGRRG